MPAPLPLTPDELLSTTRSVRRRLDLARPVEREVLEECLWLAHQAPSAMNREDWHFVVVTDAGVRGRLGAIYRRGAEARGWLQGSRAPRRYDDPARQARLERIWASALHLVEHIEEVPVLLVPCIRGRTDGSAVQAQASRWGSILPATWSFMLAARARGLGTCYTTFHLAYEAEAADALGIPFEQVMQAGLVTCAYTTGVQFQPAPREPLAGSVHWDRW